MMMRTLITTVLAATIAAPAVHAQTLNMAKALDSPHYDSQRTTWSPSSATQMLPSGAARTWCGHTNVASSHDLAR